LATSGVGTAFYYTLLKERYKKERRDGKKRKKT
jgi:hypothetical protein